MKFLRWTMSQAGAFGSGGGGGGAGTITGNDGTPEAQVANNWNIVTANSTLKFAGTAGTETIDMNGDSNNNIIMSNTLQTVSPGNNNVIIGSGSGGADGANNVSIGSGAGPALNLGSAANIAIGNGALASSSGNSCVAVGIAALQHASTDTFCIAIGESSLTSLEGSSHGNNVAIGYGSGASLSSGNFSLFLGYLAGVNYNGAESNNINLNSLGVIGESNVLRICDAANTSTGTALSKAFIGGIDGVALTTANVVTEVSDQLGTAVLTPGSGITIDATSTPNQIIISASGGGGAGTITGNDSTAEAQVGGNWNILTSGTTMGFVGTSGTETLSLSGDSNSNVFFGDPAYTYTGTPATGTQNISIGVGGIQSTSVTGSNNIAIGLTCLPVIEADYNHIAIGYQCGQKLQNTTNNNNVMIGFIAGSQLVTGGQSVLIGISAGDRYTNAEEGNICINAQGVPGESFVIRIGDSTTGVFGAPYTAAYIGGIDGVALTTANVVTEVSDQLGTAVLTPGAGITIDASSTPNQIIIELTPSSERFKQNINPISDSSSILNLKPVTFEYKPNQLNISREDATGTHYGFIAEEVRKVLPNLTYDNSKGEITGVRYNEIIPLLLSEIQKLRKDVDALKGK